MPHRGIILKWFCPYGAINSLVLFDYRDYAPTGHWLNSTILIEYRKLKVEKEITATTAP